MEHLEYLELRENFKAVIHEWDDEIYIAMIFVDKVHRNSGIGTKYMEEMIDYATRYKKKISLIPSDIFGSNLKKLKKFYTGLGFKQINKKWYYFT
jgi:GNAT superfamily N-acetyltransferase